MEAVSLDKERECDLLAEELEKIQIFHGRLAAMDRTDVPRADLTALTSQAVRLRRNYFTVVNNLPLYATQP